MGYQYTFPASNMASKLVSMIVLLAACVLFIGLTDAHYGYGRSMGAYRGGYGGYGDYDRPDYGDHYGGYRGGYGGGSRRGYVYGDIDLPDRGDYGYGGYGRRVY